MPRYHERNPYIKLDLTPFECLILHDLLATLLNYANDYKDDFQALDKYIVQEYSKQGVKKDGN